MNIAAVCAFCLFVTASSFQWKKKRDSNANEYILVQNASLEKNWYDADDTCRANGGYLSLMSKGVIADYIPTFHIDPSVEIGYVWMSVNMNEDLHDDHLKHYGDRLVRQFGLDAEANRKCVAVLPERLASNQSHVTITKNARWKSFNCGKELGFVCWRKVGNTTLAPNPLRRFGPLRRSGNCPGDWSDAGTKRCYKAFEHATPMSWEVAERTCLSLPYYKPNIACAETRSEIDSLGRLVVLRTRAARFWFGLFREERGGPWMWADNSRFVRNETNFHRYIKQEYDYGRGVVDNRAIPRGSWDVVSDRDGLRSEVRRYICQVEKDPNYNYTMPGI